MTAPATPRPHRPPLLREAVGRSLKHHRATGGQSLRDVSAVAQISAGYLSELERGRKEASSEMLAAVCQALGITVADVLIDAAVDMRAAHAAHRVRPVTILPQDAQAARARVSAPR